MQTFVWIFRGGGRCGVSTGRVGDERGWQEGKTYPSTKLELVWENKLVTKTSSQIGDGRFSLVTRLSMGHTPAVTW